MRSIRCVAAFILSFVFIQWMAFAQSPNYKHIGHTGEIQDERGNKLGKVTKDQIILDNKGKKIAFIDNQGNLVDAQTNQKLGRIGKDGKTYYNAAGQVELTVKDNGKTCDVLDAKGNKIGNVHSSLKGSACALVCFQERHLKKPNQQKP
ncbi:5-fold beta-flower protein [Larkinella insperata]|uniref:5-fold beta-flower protein n=1 Tax=Larkinella insperata TaxID=332158 RepID=A0ABW3Q384_9BACT